jgi:hypothetical protein
MMEQDKPKNLLIVGYTLAIVGFLIVTVVFVDQYLRADVKKEYQLKVLGAPSTQLRNLQAIEDGRLGKYQWVDQGKGVVRIPLDRARELTLKDWAGRKDGLVPAFGAEATPAAPAPAAPAPGAPTPGATVNPADPTGQAPAAPAPAAPAPAAPAPAAAPAAPAPAPAPAPGGQR